MSFATERISIGTCSLLFYSCASDRLVWAFVLLRWGDRAFNVVRIYSTREYVVHVRMPCVFVLSLILSVRTFAYYFLKNICVVFFRQVHPIFYQPRFVLCRLLQIQAWRHTHALRSHVVVVDARERRVLLVSTWLNIRLNWTWNKMVKKNKCSGKSVHIIFYIVRIKSYSYAYIICSACYNANYSILNMDFFNNVSVIQ